ncbi:hypothetical protein PV682_03760 [Streptomyces niveiscabiei]|uniref:hypothetical protein n=1 Tax=Streptomyces niveiscabiei TaxID=164115 RepID=UPI0029AC6F47|nr:hypothetical protein [Streptomyces niveiscabiei]MDX3380563.1 hypothetical protein [Streptomyces niveiscabiei]
MAEANSIVTDLNEYLHVRSRSAATFDLDARLPNRVFRENPGDSLFCEFDAVLTPEFWPALCTMARWHGDEHIGLLVLEPDCDAFYVSEYGMHPAMSLSVEADADDYWAAIGYEPDGDIMGSIAISANVIAVTGPSGKWGCWGERDPEVAVFRGFPNAVARNEWCTQFGPFLEVSGALKSYLPLTFAGRTVPDEYAATLTANYGPTGSRDSSPSPVIRPEG